MANDLTLADFLNPFTPLRLAAGGAKAVGTAVVGGAGSVVRGTVDTGARGIATATQPMADAASDVASFLSASVKEVGETIRDTNKKILIGEVVLVGGVVALAGIAAWYLSKSPEARARVWDVGSTGAKFLLTKGG